MIQERSQFKSTNKKNKHRKDLLADFVYDGLNNGITGAAFTSYKSEEKKSRIGTSSGARLFLSLSSSLSKMINSSFIVCNSSVLAKKLLSAKLRVYGMFFATFGVYTLLFYFAENFLLTDAKGIYELFFGAAMLLLSVPFIFSDETLSSALCNSSFGSAVKKITGIHTDSMKTAEVSGRLNYSFILGVAAGVLSYAVGPYRIFFAILFLFSVWIISSRPEFGLVTASFLVPFVSLSSLILILAVTAFFFLVKVVRGKRYLVFETLDAAVLGIFLMIFFGGVVSVSSESYKEAFLYCVLILLAYFLTVNIMRVRIWLDRMSAALVIGFALACTIFAFSQIGDATVGGVSNAISDIFGRCLLGDMLLGNATESFSQVCVLIIPIAVSFLFRSAINVNKVHVAMAVALMLYPALIYGFSAAAAVCLALVLLFLICSKKAMYILFALALLIPTASYIFPEVFSPMSEYMSGGIEVVSESVISVWKGTASLISECVFGGIGFGAQAWNIAYPRYALSGSENAPHAFSLYLQMWTGTGILGLLVLLVFIFLFASCVFTLLAEFNNAVRHPALKHSGLRANIPDSLDEFRIMHSSGVKHVSTEQFRISGRVSTAAPFCGVVGALALGLFNDIWYDARVFLVFWLATALGAAYARTLRWEMNDILSSYENINDPSSHTETDIG